MDDEQRELKKKLRSKLRLDFILPEDLPEIELYMDQVTRFMDQYLGKNKRSEDDKVLTKTMINNYTRNHLVPPPEKKRYSREHLILLIYIYYLKNVLSISDIQKLLEPLQEEFASPEKMTRIYEDIYELEKPWYFTIEQSTLKAASLVEKKFPESEEADLNKLAFIYLLAYDMFSKKRLIETLIDEMTHDSEEKKALEAERQKKAKAREKAKKQKLKSAKKSVAGKTAAGRPAAKTGAKTGAKPGVRKTAPVKKTAAKAADVNKITKKQNNKSEDK